MAVILADTNAVIYFLKGSEVMLPYLNEEFALSEISEMELLGVKNISEKDLELRSTIIANSILYPFISEIKKLAISLKQKTKLKIPDAIIAATAIYFNIPLLTADKEFKKIEGLSLILLDL